MRKLMLGSLIAVTLAGVSIPAAARTNVDFYLNIAPPVTPVQYVPAPRVGYDWVPGHWEWRGDRRLWVKGHYVRHRPAHYGRDTDRDGIPNRYDRDRDNDGVANRYDRAPNNPYYR